LFAFFIYLLVFGFNKEYGYIYLIQSINILAATFDISWFYMGLEDFKKTVTRNLIVKIICIISIFIFIQTPSDLSKYLLINVLMALLGNLVMWMYIPNIVSKVNINFKDIISHFYPTIKLFIPQIAVQIYSILDRTQLGILSNVSEVGLYEQSQKIIRLVLGLLTCTSAVMLPRMSSLFAHGDSKKMDRYLNTSLKATSYICIPMAFGLIGISKEFVPWFFGKDFLDISYLLVILTPILFFIGMSSIMGNQYLLPSNQTKVYTISVTSGSIINVILNFLLIPKFQSIGTCISSVVAEFTVMLIQYIILRKNIDI
ncbi:MAG: Polysaccharide Transporter, PST family, partial [Streptococcus sp. DORA_10]